MRISDWSSDVCSSDLLAVAERVVVLDAQAAVLERFGEDRLAAEDATVLLEADVIGGGTGDDGEREAQVAEGDDAGEAQGEHPPPEIGRASCRERVGQYV